MGNNKFTSCFSCIDGGLYLFLMDWIRSNYNVDHVNLITDICPSSEYLDTEYLNVKIRQYRELTEKQDHIKEIFVTGYAGNDLSDKNEAARKHDLKTTMMNLQGEVEDRIVIALWVSRGLEVEPVPER